MKKNILNELNRVREIMGLKTLLEQKTETNVKSKVSLDDAGERIDQRRERKDKTGLAFMDDNTPKFKKLIEVYKNDLYNYVREFKFGFNNDQSFYQNLLAAIGGTGNQSIFYKFFHKAQTSYKALATIIAGDYLVAYDDGKIPVRLLQTSGKGVYVSYTDSKGDEIKSTTPSELCEIINQKNRNTLGTTQITDISFPTSGALNSLRRTIMKDGLCLFSAEKTTETYSDEVKVTQEFVQGTPAKEATVSAEGDPIKGGDAFEVYEVAPDPEVVETIINQIKQGAGEGLDVVNVVINGVASKAEVTSKKIPTWKANVGEPYNTWGNEQILKIKDGTFTEPVTGNQVLAYLRAQNLGKALEQAGGIKVTNYNYSVGGDEMKVDVMISQEKPGEAAVPAGADTPEITVPGGKIERIVKAFSGSLNKVVVEFPTNMKDQRKYRDKDTLNLAKAMIDNDAVISED